MRVLRSKVVGSRLPVIDEQFPFIVVEQAVFVHTRGCVPPLADALRWYFDDGKAMLNVKEQAAWTTRCGTERSRWIREPQCEALVRGKIAG